MTTDRISLDDIDWDAIQKLEDYCHQEAKARGFWEDIKLHPTIESMRSFDGNLLMLVVGEASEAHEELRSGHSMSEIYYNVDSDKPDKPEGVPAELADTAIRVFDVSGGRKVGVVAAMRLKLAYNETRPYRHGRKF